MAIKVCINGAVFDEAQARVPVLDRGFLYGDSVFEVMRTYGGVPCQEDGHLLRLQKSCERVLIPWPVGFDTWKSEIRHTLDEAAEADSYIRLIITRGSGPINYDPTTARDPLRVVIVTPFTPHPKALYENGVAVVTVRAARPTDDRAAGAKASNYLANLLASHEARQRGGFEAILLGPGGQVLEGASSNVFVVTGGIIRTPPVESGILAGITRALVLRAADLIGAPVEETTLFPRDLYDASEVFLTSSLKEVMPVASVDGRPIQDGRPGALTLRLLETYRTLVP